MRKADIGVAFCTIASVATLAGKSIVDFDLLDWGVLGACSFMWAVLAYAKWRNKA
ncbi:hypothetical protein [Selenomonas ruminantium]|uniref:hypothetical protein n=1 Tax=Selenomonas ruminantium TaxID=971 RepID=UPI0003FA3D31|nr:hypothetical protein [Selenomonas ruminantium]